MRKLKWWLCTAVATLAVLAVACGGSDGSSSTPGGSGAASGQVLDLTMAAQKLQEVKSFRFDMALKMDVKGGDAMGAAFLAMFGNMEADGAYVAPDNFEGRLKFFGQEIRYVQIGNEAWINEGGGWQAAPVEAGFGFFGGSPTEMPFEFLPAEVLRGAKTKSETVNGIKATRFTFDKNSLADLAQQLGEDTADLEEIARADLDIWVTDEGLPVKMVMKMAGKAEGSDIALELVFNIKDLNKDIKIQKPRL